MITYEMILEAMEDLVKYWGEDGKKVVEVAAILPPLNMDITEFLPHCTAMGGNWGGMLLSGLRELRPEVWDVIPDDMGCFAWQGIINTLVLCGVDTSD